MEEKLEYGKIYNVSSQRKGKFQMKLIHQDETWATGVITNGRASALSWYNEVEEGEEVTVREEHTVFKPVEDAK